MANNRIYIRCNVCGEALYLGKHFRQGFYWENYAAEEVHLEDELNEFFDEHKYCAEKPRNGPLYPYDEEAFPVPGKPLYDGCGDFSIAYEFVEEDDDNDQA